jgi:hypothetical protein
MEMFAFAALATVLGTATPQWSAIEEAKLKPDVTEYADGFGKSVALSGDRCIVGAFQDEGSGRASIFRREGTTWALEATLQGSGASADDFGYSVDIDGDWAVVGAPGTDVSGGFGNAGSAHVFLRQGSDWVQTTALFSANPQDNADFGRTVAISADNVIVGARHENVQGQTNVGAAYVFGRYGTTWLKQQKLVASDKQAYSTFAEAVAIDVDRLVIGAPGVDKPSFNAGQLYVFERNGDIWVETKKLRMNKPKSGDEFGTAVALEGDFVVGASLWDDTPAGNDTGSATFFRYDGSDWVLETTAFHPGGESADLFGTSVSLSGSVAMIGAVLDDTRYEDEGTATLYHREDGSWTRVRPFVADQGAYRLNFGQSVAVEDGYAVVGAVGANPGGAAYVLRLVRESSSTYCTAGTSALGCSATLSTAGAPSANAATGFTVVASGVEGTRDGLFFFGANGRQAATWGNGTSYQCVAPPVRRGGLIAGTGTAGACDGELVQDLNALWCPSCPKPSHNPGVGAVLQTQLWYRDPASTSNRTTSLSDAVEVWVGL